MGRGWSVFKDTRKEEIGVGSCRWVDLRKPRAIQRFAGPSPRLGPRLYPGASAPATLSFPGMEEHVVFKRFTLKESWESSPSPLPHPINNSARFLARVFLRGRLLYDRV